MFAIFTRRHVGLQGGPAKVKPTCIFE